MTVEYYNEVFVLYFW